MQQLADPGHLGGMLRRVQVPPQQLEAQEDEIGVQHVGLAIVANASNAALEIHVPYLGTVHPDLAGKAEQRGDIVQTRAASSLESGQHVHQIYVPPVEAAQVIAEAKARVVVPRLPIARGGNAMQQAAIMKLRQIESRAVPRH